jgi:hypothetical protein
MDIMKSQRNDRTAILSVDLDMISVLEMQFLLKNYTGYIDGDKRKLKLFLNVKEKRV